MSDTFQVPAQNLTRLQSVIAELAKKQAKVASRGELADYTPISLVVGERVVRESEQHGREVFFSCVVTGTAPRLAGWRFTATLQHEESGTIVRRCPGFEWLDLSYFRSAATECDHCRVNRRRNDTFVVVDDLGHLRQVGRNCLSDFTGGKSPERAARMAEIIASAREACEDACGGGWGRGEPVSAVESFLEMVACSMREEGWVSRTVARESNRLATADRAWSHLHDSDARLRDRKETRMVPESADRALAANALLWAADALERDGLSDYEHNLRVSLSSGTIKARTAGIAGSLLVAYERAAGEARRKAEREAETHVAAPVGRVAFAGEVVSAKTALSDWGATRKLTVKVRCADGATWLCWVTMPAGLDVVDGQVVELVGRRVRLAATLSPGHESHFAFGKRPVGRLLADDEPDLEPVAPKKGRARRVQGDSL